MALIAGSALVLFGLEAGESTGKGVVVTRTPSSSARIDMADDYYVTQ